MNNEFMSCCAGEAITFPIMVFNFFFHVNYQFLPYFRSHTIEPFINQPFHLCERKLLVVLPYVLLNLCPCHLDWVKLAVSNWQSYYFMSCIKISTFLHATISVN